MASFNVEDVILVRSILLRVYYELQINADVSHVKTLALILYKNYECEFKQLYLKYSMNQLMELLTHVITDDFPVTPCKYRIFNEQKG